MKELKKEFEEFLKLGCKPLFISFLHKKKCYSKFKYNFMYAEPRFTEEIRFNKNRGMKDYVGTAFRWSNTAEGYDFWEHVHKDWVRYIEYLIKHGWRK